MNHDAFHHLWWLASRSAGLVAFGLAAFSVILGLTMSTGMSVRKRAARRDLHEQVALASLAALALHGLFLFGDRWLRPGIVGLLVPFTMPYRTPFTGLGILAGYVAVILGLTYYLRGRIGPRRWRSLHRLTPLVYVLAAVHALGAGADRGTLGLRLAVIGTAVPIVALLVVRIAPTVREAWDALEPAESPAITSGSGSHGPPLESELRI
jgi:sulfoxide reductase heme-binding subunit YedZ